MSRKTVKPVSNLSELRYKMADLMAAIENEDIELATANGITKAAGVIVNACKVEVANNYAMGVTKSIDFIGLDEPAEPKLRRLTNE